MALRLVQEWSRKAKRRCLAQDNTKSLQRSSRDLRLDFTGRLTASIRTRRRMCQVPDSTSCRIAQDRRTRAPQLTLSVAAAGSTLLIPRQTSSFQAQAITLLRTISRRLRLATVSDLRSALRSPRAASSLHLLPALTMPKT